MAFDPRNPHQNFPTGGNVPQQFNPSNAPQYPNTPQYQDVPPVRKPVVTRRRLVIGGILVVVIAVVVGLGTYFGIKNADPEIEASTRLGTVTSKWLNVCNQVNRKELRRVGLDPQKNLIPPNDEDLGKKSLGSGVRGLGCAWSDPFVADIDDMKDMTRAASYGVMFVPVDGDFTLEEFKKYAREEDDVREISSNTFQESYTEDGAGMCATMYIVDDNRMYKIAYAEKNMSEREACEVSLALLNK